MQFKFYDILSKLIPGVFLLSILGMFSVPLWIENAYILKIMSIARDFNATIAIVGFVFAYMAGYALDGIGSWNKRRFWGLWGGRPSYILYKKDFKEIPFPEKKKKYQFLLDRCESEKCQEKGLDNLQEGDFAIIYQFAKNIARVKANENQLNRLEQFSEAFTFSRNILWSIILSIGGSIVLQFFQAEHVTGWIALAILIMFLFICLRRARDKALFHAREVLSVAYYVLFEEAKVQSKKSYS